jgi:hypothetical protein
METQFTGLLSVTATDSSTLASLSTIKQGRMQNFGGGQLSDCNGLSGSNSLTNRVLNKKLII